MKTIFKYAAAVALTGALALAAATPSEARGGRNAAAAVGFGVGALLGAAVANSGYYGGPGYYGPGYYGPGPSYGPGPYAGPYAYEPAPIYVAPRRYYRGDYSGQGSGACWPCY